MEKTPGFRNHVSRRVRALDTPEADRVRSAGVTALTTLWPVPPGAVLAMLPRRWAGRRAAQTGPSRTSRERSAHGHHLPQGREAAPATRCLAAPGSGARGGRAARPPHSPASLVAGHVPDR